MWLTLRGGCLGTRKQNGLSLDPALLRCEYPKALGLAAHVLRPEQTFHTALADAESVGNVTQRRASQPSLDHLAHDVFPPADQPLASARPPSV